MVHAGEPLALHAEIFRTLGPVGEHQRVEAHPQELLEGEGTVGADRHMAEIGDAGIAQDLVELTSEAALHLVLVEKDAVLREASGLDVAIEQQDPGAGIGEGAGGEESRRTRPDHCDDVYLILRHGSAR